MLALIVLIAHTAAAAGRTLDTSVARSTAPIRSSQPVRRAAAIRAMSAGEISRHHPVHLSAVVTYVDPDWKLLFVQDDTAGIFVFLRDWTPGIAVGDALVLDGHTDGGDFAPVVRNATVTVAGRAPLPAPVSPASDLVATGRYDSQRAVVEGVVRRFHHREKDKHLMFDLVVNGHRVLAQFPGKWTAPIPSELVDAHVRLAGVFGSLFNQQRQLTGLQFFIPSLEAVTVLRPARPMRDVPLERASRLLQFAPLGGEPHRVRLRGTVTFHSGNLAYVSDAGGAAAVRFVKPVERVKVGDEAEVAGFPASGTYCPTLEDAVLVRASRGTPVAAEPVDAARLLEGFHEGRLVELDARLVEASLALNEQVLVLRSGPKTFSAAWRGPLDAWRIRPEPGSAVRVRGIAVGELARADNIVPATVRLLLRTPADVVVVAGPSPWPGTRSLLLSAALLVAVLASAVWGITLRRRVIAQRALLQARLQQEHDLQARYHDLFESANDVVCTCDVEGRLTSLNRAGERITGYPREEALGMRLSELVSPEHRMRVEQALAEAREVGGARLDVDLLARSGELVTLDLDARRIDDGVHAGRGVQAIGRDVTERQRIARQLQRAKEAAEAASRAKSEFVANVSHEVRTPMNGIIGMAGLLLDTRLDPLQQQYLDAIRQSATSLLRVINDVLDFSKIEAGRIELHAEPCDLAATIVDALQTLAPDARDRGLALSCRISPALPDAVVCDAQRVRQIVLNLASNALKFTHEGEVSVEVDTPAINWRDQSRFPVRLTVSDTGVGIPPEKRDAVFEAFTQADTSISRRYGGTGLGLAITAQLVRLMEGEIELTSEPGVGTTFSVDLPVEATASVERPHQPGRRVLVVDECQRGGDIAAEMLHAWELQTTVVTSTASAIAALDEVSANGRRFDVVLVDVRTPGSDALLVEALAAHAQTRAIGMALAPSGEDVDRARRLGAAQCLARPLAPSALHAAVVRALADTTTVPPPAIVRHAAAAPHVRRVLLVEDNAVNQRVASGILQKRGHEVRIAVNGRDAIEQLAVWIPDIVLMDVQMPEMDGLEATRVIRERERGGSAHVPIVAMTAHAMAGDRDRCLAAGMDGYLTKPIDRNALIECVERSMQNAAHGDPSHAFPDATVLDLDVALGRVDNDRGLLAEIASLFLQDIEDVVAEIDTAVSVADAGRIMRAAHRLKGSVATFAAGPATDAALRLETLGRAGEVAGTAAALSTLHAELNRLVPALRALIREPAA